jgi:hypothetical protein
VKVFIKNLLRSVVVARCVVASLSTYLMTCCALLNWGVIGEPDYCFIDDAVKSEAVRDINFSRKRPSIHAWENVTVNWRHWESPTWFPVKHWE